MKDNPHYLAVQEFYGDRCAKRSSVPYINHIDEGIIILRRYEASDAAIDAYCLHPIFQLDEDMKRAFLHGQPLSKYAVTNEAIGLAVEYRWVANGYLSTMDIKSRCDVVMSPIEAVDDMLIADKVQNRKDFEKYHLGKHPRSKELNDYFMNWMAILGIHEGYYNWLIEPIK